MRKLILCIKTHFLLFYIDTFYRQFEHERMTKMPLTPAAKEWFDSQIKKYDEDGKIIKIDDSTNVIQYTSLLQSDESLIKDQLPEEYVHALVLCLLCSKTYGYKIERIYHEQHFKRGSSGAKDDEADFLLYDEDGLPYALIELKPYDLYTKKKTEEDTIKYQLFATAPLAKNPLLLVYGSINPSGDNAEFICKCIDYTQYKTYESWIDAGAPYSTIFPTDYQDLDYEPYVCGGKKDLKIDCKQSDFKAVATSFHNEFFGEHPDNSLYVNLVKCLLAKIFDERTRKSNEPYEFQVFNRAGKLESAERVFERVNNLYKVAYKRYIDADAQDPDEIDPKDFSAEKVKEVVSVLQGMSITKGAALNGDVIGAFFEEILRVGFKQDKGMYFTHSNLARFMIEAVDLEGLTLKTWNNSTHPENRLPYVIDPACGSGTFLIHAMPIITNTIKANETQLVRDFESQQFYTARMSDAAPNYWAENFIYGFDPKFIMAITAKVNMVLHGDGSAHIFKYDAFSMFTKYNDTKLRPIGDKQRSVAQDFYSKEMCETFDLVLSNPPFGVTLSSDTAKFLDKAFTLSNSTPSESLFIERCFQLLKPRGRMGLVLPESVFNAADNLQVRLFLYRMFNIKAIVSLPRNVFIDTPTLTSLLFAQKKTTEEIHAWDIEWQKNYDTAAKAIKDAKACVSAKKRSIYSTAKDVENAVLSKILGIIPSGEWVVKKGKNAEIMPIILKSTISDVDDAIAYYADLLKSASIEKLILRYVFEKTAQKYNGSFDTFVVSEVGYKLSKRKEKSRPNQLCSFEGQKSGKKISNLHLCDEPVTVTYDKIDPITVLDMIKKEVKWD